MRTALSVLGVVAVAAAVNSGFVAPVASGYIYRSDNNGPASIIQLGPVASPYQQPFAFAPPLPLLQPPQKALEAYDLAALTPAPLAPAPLPYIAPKPIAIQDDEDDDDDDSDDHDNDDKDAESNEYLDSDEIAADHLDHGHAYEKGAGSQYGEQHHAAHGENDSKGFSSKDHHSKGGSGSYGKEHSEGFYSEGHGEEQTHLDEADRRGKHDEAAKEHKGENHGHKKHFSKGEDVTGYHKVFHKDEFKKDHDFYDVAHKGGHFKKYDQGHKQHGSKGGAHEEGEHRDGGYDKKGFGKAGFNAKGNIDESEENHSAEEGNESHYSHGADYGKKSGSNKEKDYEFDEEEEEEK